MTQVIELAVRTPRPGRERAFLAARDRAVEALLSVRGVGPERPFDAIEVHPTSLGDAAIGTTRYEDAAAQRRASRNLRFLLRFLRFMRTMELHLNVLMEPDDENFDLTGLATGDQVVEWNALAPADGHSDADLRGARRAWLEELRAVDGVDAVHTLTSVGGFRGRDSHVHVVVHDDRDAADRARAQRDSSPAAASLARVADVRARLLAR